MRIPIALAVALLLSGCVSSADRVRNETRRAWEAYERHASGFDELRPVSRTGRNWYAESLLITPVDSLSTLHLLGLRAEAARAQSLVDKLSFDKDIEVKNFEVTIRLLGGLLSAYEMTGDRNLLHLAENLGDRLLPVFDSPTGMPYMYVNLRTGKTRGARSNPAEIGTLIVEFGTLSRHSRNPIYFDKAKKALVELHKRRSPIGLVGEEIDVETGEWTNTVSHVGGAIDSYYEYLLKCAILFNDADCRQMWDESAAAMNRYLADGNWYGEADMNSGARSATHFGALHAFLPGVLALGGDLEGAKRLQESAAAMWDLHGIEPEVLDYSQMKVVHGAYPLRPEIIESAYVLHHFTRDPKYVRMGERFFEDLRKHCRTEDGYTVLKDVVTKEKGDLMPSYFLAETMKYLYLLFSPPGTLNFDKVVFNTEAHPVSR
jgi:mannosidase alpha-like ER degradation enhancer 2